MITMPVQMTRVMQKMAVFILQLSVTTMRNVLSPLVTRVPDVLILQSAVMMTIYVLSIPVILTLENAITQTFVVMTITLAR